MVSAFRRYPADPRAWFSEDEIARAERYRRPLRRAALAESVLTVLVLTLAVGLHLAGRLVAALGVTAPAAQVLVVTAALVLGVTVLDLPFSAWRRGHEQRWGFSRQGPAGWIGDHVKGLMLSLVLLGGAALGAWAIVRATAVWWLVLWVAASAVSVLLVMVAPAIFAPLFNRFRPLEDPALVSGALDLGRRLGVPIREVLVMDASRRTAKHNAYVTGVGRTKRVVVWDTLLDDYQAPAVMAVLAHELGHWRRHHVQWLLAITSAAILPALWLLHALLGSPAVQRWAGVTGASDPEVLPLAVLAIMALEVAWLPVAGWVSRAFERQADADAVGLIADPGPFVSMMRDLALRNLSELDPTPRAYLLASHPPAPERMALATADAPGAGRKGR